MKFFVMFRRVALGSLSCLVLVTGPAPDCTAASVGSPLIRPLMKASDVLALRDTDVARRMVFLDVRTRKSYDRAHIPGALYLSVEKSFGEGENLSRIISPQAFRKLFSQLGVHNDDYVIIYDNGTLLNAAHVFWVMEVYGHQQVSVLEGGLPAWVKMGGRLSTEVTTRPASNYVPGMAPERIATQLSTRLAMDNPDVVIIDSRPPDHYRGKESRARRAGHIPGAVNIPADRNLYEEAGIRRVRPEGQIRSLYSALGKKQHIITYCNRGRESALTYLVLRNLGYDVSVYDGAWLEWGNDPALPIDSD